MDISPLESDEKSTTKEEANPDEPIKAGESKDTRPAEQRKKDESQNFQSRSCNPVNEQTTHDKPQVAGKSKIEESPANSKDEKAPEETEEEQPKSRKFKSYPFEAPAFRRLREANVILIAGCGGGFDFTHSLPLLFSLCKLGKEVHLANLSFSDISRCDAKVICSHNEYWKNYPSLVKVTADTKFLSPEYCPEKYLSQWFREELGEERPIWTFDRAGPVPLRTAYKKLIETFNVDLVVLIDGGSDSLMAGDEEGLGSLSEDMSSLAAIRPLLDRGRDGSPTLKDAMLLILGLGADRFHGVSDSASLRAIAELTRAGAHCGGFSIVNAMEEVKLYRKALEFIHQRMRYNKSIVGTFILDSISGHFGDHHSNPRTKGSKLFINPLMSMYFFFDLAIVADRVKYMPLIYDCNSTTAVENEAFQWRKKHQLLIRNVEEWPRTHSFGLN